MIILHNNIALTTTPTVKYSAITIPVDRYHLLLLLHVLPGRCIAVYNL